MAREVKQPYVLVLPDGREYYCLIGADESAKSQADGAVRANNLTTDRSDPKPVSLELFRLDIRNGKQSRTSCGVVTVTPPLRRMETDEFNEELAEALGELPPEFHDFVRSYSNEHGHSSGYEEVMLIARDIVYGLKGSIQAYNTSVIRAFRAEINAEIRAELKAQEGAAEKQAALERKRGRVIDNR